MKNLKDYKYFINREISLIDFNERVLHEAMDERHPLLERMKFCIIFSSNIDEFFMIRVAGLKEQADSNIAELSYDGKTPKEQLIEIRRKLIPLFDLHRQILMEDIYPKFKEHHIEFHQYNELDKADKAFLDDYFDKYVFPVLTPLSFGPANPFPNLINCSLNIAFILYDNIKKSQIYSFLQVPNFLPRLVKLPNREGYHYILFEEIIKANAFKIFPGMQILGAYNFRVTRDADIEIAEDEAEDLLHEISEHIRERRWGMQPVRLELNPNFPNELLDFILEYLGLSEEDVYVYSRPLNLPDFMVLLRLDLPALKDQPFTTRIIKEFQGDNGAIFEAISQKDYLVHHPYDSFSNSVLRFLNIASTDPDVLLIKITLYRTDSNSPILEALKLAAENGKSVTAFVELKARFDEENNIVWAKKLEKSGVHVVYGVPHLKTHCKIAYIVRKEQDIFRTYVHLSTGNYNQTTARIYTDIGFFTSNPEFGKDAALLFNFLTSYSHPSEWKHFSVAPINLYQKINYLIDREIEKSTPDNPGLIFAKMNQLAHRELIPKLYQASIAGVKIQLIVRGVCCLRPGLPEISENIEVRSILGRFLEHSRIFYFKNGGDGEFYLSSADWMSRNLHNRIEVMFPIYQKNLQNTLFNILNTNWRDNTKSWRLNPDGTYTKLKPAEGEEPFIAQEKFLEEIQICQNKSKK
ncbi:MAG TPA: polyphosphate kinase 1 [Candidatus Kapabacteria bacterium]|jgi:polyphosphate kinase|nr:polyphosphate kinase 1 [Candidatus Kapabacteria bacterium]HOV91866.1 polyphosphate kinase 1 [Candidatus Kapabacteria bacterium]